MLFTMHVYRDVFSECSPFPDGEMAWFVHGLQFERGGHIVHKAYSQIILDHILQLLAHIEGSPLGLE